MDILKQQAKQNISCYIDEQLPAEYQKCLAGITVIMKESWKTAESADSEGNRRDKLQALALAKECYAMKLDLLSSATVVDRAVKFVDRNKGLIPPDKKVTLDDTTESVQDIRCTTEQLGSRSRQPFELLKGLPFYNFHNQKYSNTFNHAIGLSHYSYR